MSNTPRTDSVRKRFAGKKVSSTECAELYEHASELERELTEVTKKRDEWKELYERLNESLSSNKRLFSNKLAEKIIDDQVKRIKFLEDKYSETQKELL